MYKGNNINPDSGAGTVAVNSNNETKLYKNNAEQFYDSVTAIINYEGGLLDDRGTLELFSHLIKTGLAWKLQGSCGRAAKGLIDSGIIDNQGNIDWVAFENLN